MIALNFKKWFFESIQIQYIAPNFNNEWNEAIRYPEFKSIGKNNWLKFAKTGKPITLFPKDIKNISNIDLNFDFLEPEKKKRFDLAYSMGVIEMPIVIKFKDKSLELMSGNTRLAGLLNQQQSIKVWLLDVNNLNYHQEVSDITGISPPVQDPVKLGLYGALQTYEVPTEKYQKKCKKKMSKKAKQNVS